MMNKLKKYIAPSVQISFCDYDIVTASPDIGGGSSGSGNTHGGGSGVPVVTPGGGKLPDDWDTGL